MKDLYLENRPKQGKTVSHLFGTVLPIHKSVLVCLQSIEGIGYKQSLDICKQVSILPHTPWKALTGSQVLTLSRWLEERSRQENFQFGTDLVRSQTLIKKDLIRLGSLRGIRLRLGLPVRGQNTHTNARTAKRLKAFRKEQGFSNRR